MDSKGGSDAAVTRLSGAVSQIPPPSLHGFTEITATSGGELQLSGTDKEPSVLVITRGLISYFFMDLCSLGHSSCASRDQREPGEAPPECTRWVQALKSVTVGLLSFYFHIRS